MAELEAGIRRAETALFAQFGLTPSERFVVVDAGGARARLRVLEVGSGSPVLFLHAASWFAAHWAPLLAHLPGWRAICVDMPGHGLSDGVDYRDQDLRKLQVEIFSQLFDQLAISGAPVVGNSLGGMTAFFLALDAPKLVSRVVILGVPATALPGAKPDLLMSLLSVRGLNRVLLALPSTRLTSRLVMRSALGPVREARLSPDLFRIHSLARRRPAFASTIASWMPATHRWRAGQAGVELSDAELAALPQPLLFFWGERDAFGGPDMARRAARVLPNARTETHPGGHHPQLTGPQASARALQAFLS